ncbi:glycosyl hydrolase [Micromonospora mirobrigensis]|uniref:Beta-galactosidase trimerisation domain-containing protein n=1 Tax=Micromonospora mirobrigensis TaxID=262898 RepID=A0A1C4YYY5_9ACTN|nr:glycosyl hydrolase [Micromonospora mirobrigensis]SCF25910.1 Beta-galactosidase trimerisation domain-containing protein [Micromonospora mirobrigensis]
MLDDVLSDFRNPPPSARPTPLFWWSGGDVDAERLGWHLDQLAGSGLGGTIVGYSHHPDASVDAGAPTPFSADWWDLLRWFVDESARRELTVGFQDYNIIGETLHAVGPRTSGLRPGSLRELTAEVRGPARWTTPTTGELVTALAYPTEGGGHRPAEVRLADGELTWTVPEGSWGLSAVLRESPRLRHRETAFDPLHPDSGRAVVDALYEPFASELGDRLGRSFTTFFQDELDLAVTMPMWNDLVALRLAEEHEFDPTVWLPALWRDHGPRTYAFRAAYRDVVVDLLERHYFRPVFDWHERHGTTLAMDQLSRGDLRQGRRHYGDFLRTMRWYHGPGNDDPDLTGPRQVAAFKVSASIAHAYQRPLVFNEAFYGSGWGVRPADIVAGLHHGFAYGANHVALHGLYLSTAGGWWEWAAPDFHHRQPWWRDAGVMWQAVARLSTVLRAGRHVCDVAIVDPTQDLDLTGEASEAPELARDLLATLAVSGIDADLLDVGDPAVDLTGYRAVVVPALRALRRDTARRLTGFAEDGGVVLVAGAEPVHTEDGPVTLPAGTRRVAPADVTRELRSLSVPDFHCDVDGIAVTHRRLPDADLYLLVNVTDAPLSARCRLRVDRPLHRWDPWTGAVSPLAAEADRIEGQGVRRLDVDLAPGEALLVCAAQQAADAPCAAAPTAPPVVTHLDAGWTVEPVPVLDNSHGDLTDDRRELGVQTWHVEVAGDDGRWRPASVGDGHRFWVLGPMGADRAAELDATLPATRTVDPADGWRPYDFSLAHGVTGDPLLADRMTGPHGLKGVPEHFLDPAALDPDGDGVYYFWSTVHSTVDTPAQVVVGSRAAHTVWVAGRQVAEPAPATAAVFFPPWQLRDLSVAPTAHPCRLTAGANPVLLKLTRCADQPTRALLAVAAPGELPRPASGPATRLRWWDGPRSALLFDPVPGRPTATRIRVTVPAGATGVSLAAWSPVTAATLDGEPLAVGGDDLGWLPVDRPAELVLRFAATPGRPGAGVLAGPLRWHTAPATVPLAPWPAWGLSDFSGVVRYRRVVDMPAARRLALRLDGLVGSARVTVDGVPAGVALVPPYEVDLTRFAGRTGAVLEVEAANTLANHYARYPSPYARMQAPGGGFTGAALVRTR